MRLVVQRVKRASVTINGGERREISAGLVILIGVAPDDTKEDAKYLAEKSSGLRIFKDEAGKMNLSVRDANGECLVISQFTLYGDTRKGKRPSFVDAAPPAIAIPLYEHFIELLRNTHGLNVHTGEFGADMLVEILNDGPVTLIVESKTKVHG